MKRNWHGHFSRRWAFKAVKVKTTLTCIPSQIAFTSLQYNINAFALVEFEKTEVYGLKFHLKTLTSETIDFLPITTIKIHEMKTLKVESSVREESQIKYGIGVSPFSSAERSFCFYTILELNYVAKRDKFMGLDL